MSYYKKISCLLVMIAFIFSFTACNHQDDEIWYRLNLGEAQMNVLTISDKSEEGFHLSAACSNGANTGGFEGYFLNESENKATFSGASFDGTEYTIIIEFEADIMRISVASDELCSEDILLGFGHAVTLSGEYSMEKPVYNYSELVLEKVFLSDLDVANSVREYLGDEEYNSFVRNFGMSTYIHETEEDGYIVIKGTLRGIANWCAFCATSNGYFYVYNDYAYFSNDPIYKDNPPEFFKLN